jgi:hypothetical protein
VILPRSPHFCQNSGLSVLSSIRETEKCRVGGEPAIMFLLVKNNLLKKEEWECVLSWCNSQFFCRQSLGQSFHTFFTVAVKPHSSIRNCLFGLPERIVCEQSPWCKNKIFAFHLSLLPPPLACPEPSMLFKHPRTGHAFLPKRLS